MLQQALLAHSAGGEAHPALRTPYGQKFTVRGMLQGPRGVTAALVSVWIVLRGEDVPRFITAYPEEAR